ncbi:MAG: 7-carboxy-7-deazaguanine synthase QueE [Candidatus Nitrosotenuis sp.]|uniref:7-carboxy-7-deazaguanine synthase n=1 Tax=Candidatus Nitrosotenuis uzonensis TaxID=1407055 RepID=A0A812EZN4_9ARCH|nr:7-carboxy-7-deazaguanine synthase QueE [Candidatus Nitrosotenuis uzonensis]CAE6488943.1 7-carboxy-7-deazaguanine synthase [Candidatus Nitrosotenuis uzonensis]
MKVRLYEIFTSLEGEGILYGTKTLFVRLAGCPFTCFYCDTKESLPLDSGQEYEISDACNLIDEHLQKKTYKVNFTGGDPLVQHEAVAELAKHVKAKNIPTYLESSCFDSKRFAAVLPHIDFVKIELKTPDSEFVDTQHYSKLIENALQCLAHSIREKKTAYIKIVVSSRTKRNDFEDLVKKIFGVADAGDLKGFIIQPTYGIAEPSLQNLLSFYDLVYPYYPEVRVVPQLHKLIGAP